MKLVNLAKISLGLILAWGTAAQAEVAGRVLMAVGDASALRGSQEIKLAAGAPIETGDTLRVGEASNLQVRFTDEAIMALRPNTTMRIDDYAYAQKADADKSIFSLLKGGLRTITGVIGRSSRANYAVKSETATIGIRGTHFTLVHCNNDCRNTDGTPGQNGTFGGVTDGRIAVTNNAGEKEFGKNEYFFVASRDVLPAGLIAPPPFLRDRLEGQAKSKGKGGTGSGETARTSTDTSTTTQPSIATQPPVVEPTPYNPGDNPVINQSVLVSWVAAWGWSGYCSPYQCPIGAEGTGALSQTVSTTEFNAATSFLANYQTGFDASAGNVHWGVVPSPGSTGDHWAYGDPLPGTLPTSGIYTFTRIGGTTPTNNEGRGGAYDTSNSAGYSTAFTVNFNHQTVTGTIAYHVPGPTNSGVSTVDYAVTVNGTTVPHSNLGSTSVNCYPSCSNAVAYWQGAGFGTALKGMAAGVATYATINSVPQTTATVQVYKNTPGYIPAY